jgi:hypothetical protein
VVLGTPLVFKISTGIDGWLGGDYGYQYNLNMGFNRYWF